MSVQKKKVLFISGWYPSRVNATLGNFVKRHAEAAALYQDVAVLYVCFDPGLRGRKEELVLEDKDGIRTVYLYLNRTPGSWIRLMRFIQAYRKGLRWVREHIFNPDLIHVNVIFPLCLLYFFSRDFRGIPYVITEHWVGYLPVYDKHPGFFHRALARRMVRRAKRVLPVTDNLGQSMVNMGFRGQYTVVHNVVDTQVFLPGRTGTSPVFTFLHVSSLDDRQKNVSGIFRVAGRLYQSGKSFALHILSDGPVETFRKKAAAEGLPDGLVSFSGPFDEKGVAEAMRAADALLLFSHYENFPCVIAEAWSCGIPVITTDVGGIREHHTPRHGIMIGAGDEQELLKAMDIMIISGRSYETVFLAEYARSHFSYEGVGKQLSDIYRQTTATE